MEPKARLCAILGLDPATASDEEIAAGINTLMAEIKTLGATKEALKALTSEVEGLKTLGAKVTDLTKAIEGRDRSLIVEQAAREGKVIPPEMLSGEHALGNVQLKALCASLPVTVPLERRTITHLSADAGVLNTGTASLEVFNALGLTKEQVEKYESKK